MDDAGIVNWYARSRGLKVESAAVRVPTAQSIIQREATSFKLDAGMNSGALAPCKKRAAGTRA